MLMTVEELKELIQTDEPDKMLEMRLNALELTIRRYTNNNFQCRGKRVVADIRAGVFMSESLILFDVGDTIMVSESDLQSGCLAVVTEANDLTFQTDSDWANEDSVLVTKVEYPADVKLGAAKIIQWQIRNEAANSGDTKMKDIQSETLSRYSVTYASDSTESDLAVDMGVPKKLMAFLKLYKKARF
ncbi:hypothetical protein [Emergencia sp. 1XD21-10]|uniref:hypothetical protein n=1 Tax=Emergencia sp. 1XD21-10 TaxID=2304569 RepID=UPI00137B0D7B|nr:hypothetical protein [Emergencia sp. 1XD21-10]NCE98406.1 hypothetical protein [Emergencia sp. 1XD21-10]